MVQPAISSASSTARRMDCTVDSILTTTPFFMPRLGWEPRPTISMVPSTPISPTMQTIFEVPISRPTSIFFCCTGFMIPSPDPGASVSLHLFRNVNPLLALFPAAGVPIRLLTAIPVLQNTGGQTQPASHYSVASAPLRLPLCATALPARHSLPEPAEYGENNVPPAQPERCCPASGSARQLPALPALHGACHWH